MMLFLSVCWRHQQVLLVESVLRDLLVLLVLLELLATLPVGPVVDVALLVASLAQQVVLALVLALLRRATPEQVLRSLPLVLNSRVTITSIRQKVGQATTNDKIKPALQRKLFCAEYAVLGVVAGEQKKTVSYSVLISLMGTRGCRWVGH